MPTEIRSAQIITNNGNNELVKLDGSGALPAVDGSNLTGISGGGGSPVVGVFTAPATDNLLAGSGAGAAITSGAANNFIAGTGAGAAITTGDSNVVIGNSALPAITTTSNNVAIGPNSGLVLSGAAAYRNVLIGLDTLSRATTDSGSNVVIGNRAGRNLYSSGNFNNVVIGNWAIGGSILNTVTGANQNIAIGDRTLENLGGGALNTCLGYFSGYNVTSGNNNVCIGQSSGSKITTGGGNVCLGGGGPAVVSAGVNSKLYIDSTFTDTPMIGGDFGTNLVTMSGDLEVAGNVISHIDINAQIGLTYTLALTDDGILVTMDNASANELTIPTNALVAFPVGTQILVEQEGAGTTSISVVAGSPPAVTLHSAGGLVEAATQYSTITLIKKATDTWLVAGDLA